MGTVYLVSGKVEFTSQFPLSSVCTTQETTKLEVRGDADAGEEDAGQCLQSQDKFGPLCYSLIFPCHHLLCNFQQFSLDAN